MSAQRCPVCLGTGQVRPGFYPDAPREGRCRACVRGVVFEPPAPPTFIPTFTPLSPWPPGLPAMPWEPHWQGPHWTFPGSPGIGNWS